jgi:type I restriction enzyme, S subunit
MSWKKVRLGDILKQYRIEHRVDDKTTYKQVSILNDGNVVLRGEKIGKDIGRKRQFIIDTKKYPNTLIFTRQLLLQGSIGIASNDVHNCIVTENMPMFSIDTTKIDKEFLILFLKSKVFKARIGEIELSGSAQKSIHEKTFLNLEFVLPPFELQKTKVVELLKLKSNSDNISTELTHQLTLVKKLRQQLLQDAVQGKLVEQNKKDEPASELLKKIKAEKQKLRKGNVIEPFSENSIPYNIPNNWIWCKFGEIIQMTRGKFSIRPRNDPSYFGGEYPFIQIGSLDEKGSVINEAKQTLNEKGIKVSKRFPKNTIAIAIVGGTIGNLGVLGREMYFTDSIIGILPNPFYTQDYILNYLRYKQPEIKSEAYQMAGQPNIKIPTLENLLFPMPPLAEQNRIVQKLDELMQYCNELEASIKQCESQNEKLLQQVLREALRKEPVEV